MPDGVAGNNDDNNYENKRSRLVWPILSCLCIVIILGCVLGTEVYRRHRIIKAASPSMMQLINLGAVFGMLVVILGYFYPPTPFLCLARPTVGHVSFSLIFGSFFAKNLRLQKILVENKASENMKDMDLIKTTGILFLATVGYLVIWFSVDPPLPQTQNYNNKSYQFCLSDEPWWFYSFYIFEILFLLCGVALAWKLRNVDDIFNESRSILICLCATIGIATLVLALLASIDSLTPDEYYAILSAGIIACIMTIEAVLFGPRLYSVMKETKPPLKDGQIRVPATVPKIENKNNGRRIHTNASLVEVLKPSDLALASEKTIAMVGVVREAKAANRRMTVKVKEAECELSMLRKANETNEKKIQEQQQTIIKLMEEKVKLMSLSSNGSIIMV